MTSTTEQQQTVQITETYHNNIVWGSIDPVNTGNIMLYSPDISQNIEEQYLQPDASLASLNIFGGVQIVFNNGKPSQQTANGYRSVFRTILDDNQTSLSHNVEYNTYHNSWYLTANKTSHIGFLVDTSGSMGGRYQTVVEQGLEEFVEKQKEINHHVMFYGSTFSNELIKLFDGIDLKATDAESIKSSFYNITPSGSTAYYDAVMDMIQSIQQKCMPEDEVVICVVTDGGDNVSRHSTLQNMRDQILQKKQQGWNIIMIGMNNYNSGEVSEQYGIGRNATIDAGNSAENIRNTFTVVQQGISRVRTGQNTSVEFTQIERTSGNT